MKEIKIIITITGDSITLNDENLNDLTTNYEANSAERNRAWLAGYQQALKHCEEQVRILKGYKGTCRSSDLMYQGAESVRYAVCLAYRKYINKK